MKKLIIFIFISMTLITSCGTQRYANVEYDPDDGIKMPIEMGDMVEITTNDDRKHVIQVREVSNEYIVSNADEKFYYDDIKTLKKLEYKDVKYKKYLWTL